MHKALTTEVANLKTQIAELTVASKQPNEQRMFASPPQPRILSTASYNPDSQHLSSHSPLSARGMTTRNSVLRLPYRSLDTRSTGSTRSPRFPERSSTDSIRNFSSVQQKQPYQSKRGVPRSDAFYGVDEVHDPGLHGCTYSTAEDTDNGWA